MIIFPAIDIKGGKCVRLLKGSFDDITKYNKSYYENSSSKISDGEYDELKKEILLLEQNNKFLKSKESPSVVLIRGQTHITLQYIAWFIASDPFQPSSRMQSPISCTCS